MESFKLKVIEESLFSMSSIKEEDEIELDSRRENPIGPAKLDNPKL